MFCISFQGEERNTNSPQPTLSEAQIQTIADAANRLAKTLPKFEPKWMNIKKSLSREIEVCLTHCSPG